MEPKEITAFLKNKQFLPFVFPGLHAQTSHIQPRQSRVLLMNYDIVATDDASSLA